MCPGSAADTTKVQAKAYSRTPLTEAERALKGPTLKALIRDHYRPEDCEGDAYPYTWHGEVRTNSKGREGDVQFKVLQTGVQQLESKTAFEKRMSEQEKKKKDAKNSAAAKRKKDSAKRMLDSVKESNAASKKRKVKKEKGRKSTKNEKDKNAEVSIEFSVARVTSVHVL